MSGVDPETVKRKVVAHNARDEEEAPRAALPKNTDGVRDLVAEEVAATRARVEANFAASRAGGRLHGPATALPAACHTSCQSWASGSAR